MSDIQDAINDERVATAEWLAWVGLTGRFWTDLIASSVEYTRGEVMTLHIALGIKATDE
jgi:hypothetical protein